VLRTPEIFLSCRKEEVSPVFLNSAAIGGRSKSVMFAQKSLKSSWPPQQTLLNHTLQPPRKPPKRKKGHPSLKQIII